MARDFRNAVRELLESMPDANLTSPGTGTIAETDEVRLDMQGMTTVRPGQPLSWNLQVQANEGTETRSIAKKAPDTLAHVNVPVEGGWTAQQIKDALYADLENWLTRNISTGTKGSQKKPKKKRS